MYWDSVVPGAQGAGVGVVHQNDYVTATPGSWAGSPATQDAAIDRLAVAVAGLLGHPIP